MAQTRTVCQCQMDISTWAVLCFWHVLSAALHLICSTATSLCHPVWPDRPVQLMRLQIADYQILDIRAELKLQASTQAHGSEKMAFTYDQHGQSYPQQQYPRTQPPMSSAEYYAQLDPVYPPHSEDANTGNNSQPSSTTERQQYSETTVPLLPSKDNAIPRLDDAQYFPPPESKSSIRPQRDTAFSPYLSKTSAFLSIWVPFTILALTLGGLWG